MLARLAAVLFATLVLAAPAAAQNRRALVIGINAYPGLISATDRARGQLVTALNDARAVAATLREIGFSVTLAENVSRRQMSDAIGTLEEAVKPGDVVFLYFAGHGLEIENANWLVPADFPPPVDAAGKALSVRAIKDSAFGAGDIIAGLRARGARTVIAVFDACREFVDARNARSLGVSGGGLGPMNAPDGVFVLMSAGMRQLALDRLSTADQNPNSVFARVLLPLLREPGLSMTDLALKLRPEVTRLAASVNHVQRPTYYDELSEPFVLVPARAPAPVAAAPAARPADPLASVRADYERAERLNSPAAWAAFLATSPPEPYGSFARAAQQRLAGAAPAPAALPVAPRPAAPPPVVASAPPPPPAAAPADEAALRPRDVFKDCAECPEMVVVPPGEFAMGSPQGEPRRGEDEAPRRRVTFAQAFAVGRFEVTFAEWDACRADGGCRGYEPGDEGWGRGRRPAIYVSWQDAQAYAAWLTRKTGRRYRLLTEAEWEYAARAGTATPFWTGRSITPQDANYDGNYAYADEGTGLFRKRTLPVGSFRPNAFGLFDMHGNVLEWVADCYAPSYAGAPPTGEAVQQPDCPQRVLRGGSWNLGPNALRSAYRGQNAPDSRDNEIGFRIARTLGQ